jgi:hypothetical protein
MHARYCKYFELVGLFCDGGSIHVTAASQKVNLMAVAMEVLESLFTRLVATISDKQLKVPSRRAAAVSHLKECLAAIRDPAAEEKLLNKDELKPQLCALAHMVSPTEFELTDVNDSVTLAAKVQKDTDAQANNPMLKAFLISKAGGVLFQLAQDYINKKSSDVTLAAKLAIVKQMEKQDLDVRDAEDMKSFIMWQTETDALKLNIPNKRRNGDNELRDAYSAMVQKQTTMLESKVRKFQIKKIENIVTGATDGVLFLRSFNIAKDADDPLETPGGANPHEAKDKELVKLMAFKSDNVADNCKAYVLSRMVSVVGGAVNVAAVIAVVVVVEIVVIIALVVGIHS